VSNQLADKRSVTIPQIHLCLLVGYRFLVTTVIKSLQSLLTLVLVLDVWGLTRLELLLRLNMKDSETAKKYCYLTYWCHSDRRPACVGGRTA